MNKVTCPKCGSENIIPIIYGYPTNDMFAESDNGECILGGCCIEVDESEKADLSVHHCNDCGFEW